MSDFKLSKHQDTFETQKRHYERKVDIENKMGEIPRQYEGDIRRCKEYCTNTSQLIETEALLDYLYISLTKQRIKKATWERRLAAIRKYLTLIHSIDFKGRSRVAYELSAMRKMYREDQYAI
ncbi:hypothetical protein [Sporosarcina sp. P17b]|uniref:hypothetical protein n=1 Tax=Sporosarcina sp. P17b TaxID=2048260 RepID=UPI001E574F12|nr:hypothetical protein [Sporosarcina sp. P17b]